jgi:hypothetical protein
VTATTPASTFRIDRDFGSTRLGVYRGDVGLEATGQVPLDVDAYFQATVVAGDLPPGVIPYNLRLQDAWDQSILKEQVTLEGDLEAMGQGLQNNLGSHRPTLDFFGALAGNKSVGFMKDYLKRRPTDLLIGFTIARNAGGDLEASFEDAFGYFDDGAKWSIASAILDVKSKPILASLERLSVATGVVAADGSAAGGQPDFSIAAAAAANIGGAAPSQEISGGSPPGAEGGNDPGGEDPKPNDPDKNPPKECSSSAECTAQEVVDQIPRPTPSPTGAPDLIDGDL